MCVKNIDTGPKSIKRWRQFETIWGKERQLHGIGYIKLFMKLIFEI